MSMRHPRFAHVHGPGLCPRHWGPWTVGCPKSEDAVGPSTEECAEARAWAVNAYIEDDLPLRRALHRLHEEHDRAVARERRPSPFTRTKQGAP